MEYKSFVSQTKEIEGRKVAGFAAIFGNIDLGNDRMFNGAFKKTIKEGSGWLIGLGTLFVYKYRHTLVRLLYWDALLRGINGLYL